jgi:ribosomal protein S18 acetylase RimI-like enzyme
MTTKSDPRDHPAITLRPMTSEEFPAWQERVIESYADEVSQAADVPIETALQRARDEFPQTLPDGPDTEGVWLMRVLDEEGQVVGTLWVGPHPLRADAGFVYDVEIDPGRRGRGIGRAAMLAAERLLAEAGFRHIGLNVFGPNVGAKRLYDSLGYRVVATQMLKPLPEPTP